MSEIPCQNRVIIPCPKYHVEMRYNHIVIYIDSCSTLRGSVLSCKKCTVSQRCESCNYDTYFDYDNLLDVYEEDSAIEMIFNDDEIDSEATEGIYIDIALVKKGLVCWAFYGGSYKAAQVVSRNKQKRTAYVRMYTETGLNEIKQLVSVEDLCAFEHNFNEAVIGENEKKRDIYLNACSDLI